MSLSIYNTLTHSKELFIPRDAGRVGIYACGLTPQGPAHLGHMRGALAFDVIRRWFEYRGYTVTMVQNFTDVDDKIIRKADEEGVSTEEIAARFSAAYMEDWNSLSIKPVKFVKVTENIDTIVELIQRLFDRGHAYSTDAGDVYLSVPTIDGYGKLSRRRVDELEQGTRIEPDPAKRDPMDFALWKAARPGEPSWPSPWGNGRPGWHIECSALALHFLGNSFDIHGGGIDLLFPHHENEIAQSEAGTGCVPFAKTWMHWGSVNSDGTKMSKSLGNFFTIREILTEYPAQVLRLYLLSTHYRAPIDYAPERLAETARSYERIRKALNTAQQMAGSIFADQIVPSSLARFEEAMDDDFNSAAALGVVFEALSDLNRSIASPSPIKEEIAAQLFTVRTLLGLLGVEVPQAEGFSDDALTDRLIEKAVAWRKLAREAKQYSLSDKIRDDLKELGVVLEDRRRARPGSEIEMTTQTRILRGKNAFLLLSVTTVLFTVVACSNRTSEPTSPIQSSAQPAGTIPAGVTIDGVAVGGLLPEAARQAVLQGVKAKEAAVEFRLVNPLTKDYYHYSLQQFGGLFDIDSAIKQAMSSPPNTSLTMPIKVNQSLVSLHLSRLAEIWDIPLQEPKVVFGSDGVRSVAPGHQGASLDTDSALPTVLGSLPTLESPKEVVNLPFKTSQPQVDPSSLGGLADILTSYTTTFNPGNATRTNNLLLAVKNINGTVVGPGEIFSYNNSVGPRTQQTGFQDAIIYVDNRMKKDVGGGICQASSTLYNAVLLANLPIVERHAHSLPVHYVPAGRDATVAWGGDDFRFQNNLSKPIIVRAVASPGGTLTEYLIGDRSTLPHPDADINIEVTPKMVEPDGFKVYSYRVVKDNGVLIAKEPLGESYYHNLVGGVPH